MRKNLLAGNWKMNMSIESTKDFFADLISNIENDGISVANLDLVIGAPYTLLSTGVSERPSYVSISSQNVHWETNGAFTGEISAPMLKELGVEYAIRKLHLKMDLLQLFVLASYLKKENQIKQWKLLKHRSNL
jgi:triosephosphate isomerase